MSGVLARNRGESRLGYYDNARNIQVEIIRLMGSEKIIPKSYRFTLALPTVQDAKRLVQHVTHGSDFYPSDPQRLWERKRHWLEAVGCCDDLIMDLQLIREVGLAPDTRRFDRVVAALEHEKAMLRNQLRQARVVGSKLG
ncbi:hypothetical protein [Bifidobacterium rousetti]|uniref:hypothetical protein n=1 Tax=Bifidobacterium rousetti TaxID=2045439 RepID=UPI001239BA5D|nr:hypothetical protein [Bifidobacterium rousetti]